MRLTKHLNAKAILLDLHPETKEELIRTMATALSAVVTQNGDELAADAIISGILAREARENTGFGNGLAFPHARYGELDTMAISLAVLRNGIDYGSRDQQPVKVVCMILAPETKPTLTLKTMAQLARFFKEPGAMDKLLAATTGAEVSALIDHAQIDLDVAVTALDIMAPPDCAVTAATSLRKVTHMMSRRHLNALPVIDDQRQVIGEISCAGLFQTGMPEFFTKLKSVGFICEFDPFDQYFAAESQASAADVMDSHYCVMPPTATLLEIVFALTVKNFPAVYVVEPSGKLIGIIDQSTVLDHVINV